MINCPILKNSMSAKQDSLFPNRNVYSCNRSLCCNGYYHFDKNTNLLLRFGFHYRDYYLYYFHYSATSVHKTQFNINFYTNSISNNLLFDELLFDPFSPNFKEQFDLFMLLR